MTKAIKSTAAAGGGNEAQKPLVVPPPPAASSVVTLTTQPLPSAPPAAATKQPAAVAVHAGTSLLSHCRPPATVPAGSQPDSDVRPGLTFIYTIA